VQLKDRVAIVTGAASGIGFACAREFAAEGAKVVLADIDEAKGETAAETLQEEGYDVLFLPCDVGDKGSVDRLVERTAAAFGRLDCMVANAAILHVADFLELEEEDFDRVIRVNLKGAFLCNQAAARQMVREGHGGAIINMSSVNAVLAIPAIGPYVVAKGGLGQLTRVASLALAEKGIRVNAIGPGSIATEMFEAIANDPEKLRGILARTPMGRPGEPREIARVAVFLASENASYITGETIFADGGRMGLNYTVPVKD